MLLTTLLLTASVSTAQVPREPTPNNVKTVLDYYYGGSKPILADFVICKTVEMKDKATKHDCKETFGPSATKGELAYAYMTVMVPRDMKAQMMVQAAHNGVVRATKDITLSGNWIRSRAYRAFRLSKPGKWEFKVLTEDGKVLKSLAVEVADE